LSYYPNLATARKSFIVLKPKVLSSAPASHCASQHHYLAEDVCLRGAGVPVRSVLIVDDNAMIRQALCELFVREGDFDVCGEAENGREAIEKAQLLHPDLIVTDLSMPGMNGL
jgi:PleD family two-component response regulator